MFHPECSTRVIHRPDLVVFRFSDRGRHARSLDAMPFGPVDPDLDLLALEERVAGPLARATTSSRRRPGSARAASRGSSTRARRPPTAARACTTSGPASSRTSTPASRPCGAATCPARAAGTATACRSSSRSRRSSGSTTSTRSRPTASPSSTSAAGSRCTATSRTGRRSPSARGRLDRHRRRLLDARQRLRRVGLVAGAPAVGQGPALRGPPGRRPTAPAAAPPFVPRGGRPGLPGRRRPVGLRPLPADRRGERRTDADLLVWTTTPWTLISNVAAAVGPDIAYVRVAEPDGGRDLVMAEAAAARRYPGAEVARALARPAPTSSAGATSGRSTFLEPVDGTDGRRVVAADFVTTDDGSGIVHLAPAFGEDDAEVGRAEGLPVLNPVDPDGAFDQPRPPVDRPVRQGRRRRHHRRPRAAAACSCAERAVRAQLPALLALRHAAHLLGQDVVVRPHVRAARATCCAERAHRLAPRAHQARPLRQAGSRTTSTGPCPATATGARRCPSGAAATGHDTCVGSVAELARAAPAATCPTSTCTARSSTRSPSLPARRLRRHRAAPPAGARRLVRLGLDAVGPAPLPVRGRRRRSTASVPRRLHLRGHRPDPRLVLLAAGRQHARVRRDAVPQRRVPRPHRRRATARRCRSPRAT